MRRLSLLVLVGLLACLAIPAVASAQSCPSPSPCCQNSCGPLAPALGSPPDVSVLKGCAELCLGGHLVACYGGSIVDLAGFGLNPPGSPPSNIGFLNTLVSGEVEVADGCLCIGALGGSGTHLGDTLCLSGDSSGAVCAVPAAQCAAVAQQECSEAQTANTDADLNLLALIGHPPNPSLICPSLLP